MVPFRLHPMLDYIFILLAVTAFALQFSCVKWYQARTVNAAMSPSAAAERSFFLSMGCSGFTVLIFFAILLLRNSDLAFTAFSLRAAVGMVVISTLCGLVGVVAFSRGNIATYILFMMLGGMMLPFLAGILVWGEPVSPWRIVGLILLTVSLFAPMLKSKQARNTKIFLLLCVIVFFLNGSISVVTKYHQRADRLDATSQTQPPNAEASQAKPERAEAVSPPGPRRVDELSFVLTTGMLNAPVNALLWLLLRIKRGRSPMPEVAGRKNTLRFAGVNWLIIAAYALVSGLGYLLLLHGAAKLDASILYPMVTGGTIVLTATAGFIFFREKPTRHTFAGLALATLATLLFLGG